ncbi:MAG: nitroreductase family protein [Planctomycetota bacterium]
MEDSYFMQLIKKRRSIRNFLPKPVEREKIISCIEAARLAPSAENVQPWRFIVIDEPELRDKLCRAAFSGIYKFTKWANKAPVIVAVCAKLDLIANFIGKHLQGTQYYLLDIGICGEHLMLRAVEQGLGGCWIGWFNAKKSAEALNLPKNWRPACLIALGYYEEPKKSQKGRKALSDICYFNSCENS